MPPLSGCRLVYTRAAAYFPAFAAKIDALGGTAAHLPLVDTRPLAPDADTQDFCRRADHLIFTSAAAVRHFPAALYQGQSLVAIGPATAAALHDQGQSAAYCAPPPFNSESLLRQFRPQGQRIAVIAARGGRQLLYQTLQADNHIRFAYVYERYNPSPHWPPALALPHALLLSSRTALGHLTEISAASTLNLLQSRTALIALSPRIGQAAQAAGFQQVIAAPQADEDSQIQQLCQWWQQFKEYRT